jgi:hypothetical protein
MNNKKKEGKATDKLHLFHCIGLSGDLVIVH